MTLNEIRCNGFWVINGSAAVRSHIYRCVISRKLRCKLGDQKMAHLPEERLSDSAPFTYVGMDICLDPLLLKKVERS